MEKFIVIKSDSRDEWLENRKIGIGGSDSSALVGLNPYKTNRDLWNEKMGFVGAVDISNKPAVLYGTQAESHLRNLFELDFPTYIVEHDENCILQSVNFPWMLYSPDGILTDKKGRKGILEIKTTTIQFAKAWEAWDGGIPQHYYIQVLHGLLVTGFDFVVVKAQIKSIRDGELSITTRHYFIEASEIQSDLAWLQENETRVYNEYYLTKKQPPLNINFKI